MTFIQIDWRICLSFIICFHVDINVYDNGRMWFVKVGLLKKIPNDGKYPKRRLGERDVRPLQLGKSTYSPYILNG